MMSIRSIARSAPRALSRFSSAAIIRSPAAARSSQMLKTPSAFLRPQQLSAFSTSVFRGTPAGESDDEVSAKLASEIEFEQDVKENEPVPSSIKDFLDNGPFAIEDIPGQQEVKLTRTFGNENITVKFSIGDLQLQDELYDDDHALSDEDLEEAGSSRAPATQESRGAAELSDEGVDEDLLASEAAVPVRLSIVVEKDGNGALQIEATAQDGSILVENLHYYTDAAVAHGASPDLDYKAQSAYSGPPFGSLDEDLQILVERYLEERGITPALAVFAPDYIDMKEQKEYLEWLKNVKTFIDA